MFNQLKSYKICSVTMRNYYSFSHPNSLAFFITLCYISQKLNQIKEIMRFVITAIIKVDKIYKNRMPDKEMINRLVKEKLTGEINENYFRGNVVLNITDIDVIVQEI